MSLYFLLFYLVVLCLFLVLCFILVSHRVCGEKSKVVILFKCYITLNKNRLEFWKKIFELFSLEGWFCRLSKNYWRQSLRREPRRREGRVPASDACLMPNARVASQPKCEPRVLCQTWRSHSSFRRRSYAKREGRVSTQTRTSHPLLNAEVAFPKLTRGLL